MHSDKNALLLNYGTCLPLIVNLHLAQLQPEQEYMAWLLLYNGQLSASWAKQTYTWHAAGLVYFNPELFLPN